MALQAGRPHQTCAGQRRYFFGDHPLNLHLGLTPILSLLAGILILVMPRLLNYIVAVYLIVIGLVGLFGAGNLRI